jgi:hypothetical protein
MPAKTTANDDYVAYDGEAGAREAGKLGIEKEYVVKDGDVLLFRFNVYRGAMPLDLSYQRALGALAKACTLYRDLSRPGPRSDWQTGWTSLISSRECATKVATWSFWSSATVRGVET